MPTLIDVKGKAEVNQPPERAILSFQVQIEGTNKKEISERAIKEGNENAKMIKGYASLKADGAALPYVTSWSMSALNSQILWQEDKKAPRRHLVQIKLEAHFSDFEALNRVVSGLSSEEVITISSIQWTLTDETKSKLISAVRKAAVADAQQKAQDYSEALGLEILSCESITSFGGPSPAAFGMRMFKAAPVGGEQAESLSLEPADVSLEVTLNAKFVAGQRS